MWAGLRQQKMQAAVRLLYAALMVLSSLASVCGNVLLLLVLLLNRDLQTDALGLTLSFSISDLVLGLSIIPLGAHGSLARPAGYPSDGAFCQASGFVFLLLQTSSIHSLTWATVHKFTEIVFALSHRSLWTAWRTRLVLAAVWTFCLASAAMPLLGFGGYAYSEARFLCCLSFSPAHACFVAAWVVVGIVAPILTTCSLYAYIVYVAVKQARRGTFMCNELHCFYVPANNYLRSSVVMVTTSGELVLHHHLPACLLQPSFTSCTHLTESYR